MIRRRRLIITPGPGRQLPDPEDPSLPQVSPNQPPQPLPPPPMDAPPPGPPDDDEPRGAAAGHAAWLRALGVDTDRDSRRTWLEPHLWAALRARVDASVAERRGRWSPPGPAPQFR